MMAVSDRGGRGPRAEWAGLSARLAMVVATAVVVGLFVGAGGGVMMIGVMVAVSVCGAAFLRPDLGALSIIVLVAVVPRNELFAYGLPAFGGGLKITDVVLAATMAGWLVGRGRSEDGDGCRPERRAPSLLGC